MHRLVLDIYLILMTFPTVGTTPVSKVHVRDPCHEIIMLISKRRIYLPAFDYFMTGLHNDYQMRICRTPSHKRGSQEKGLLCSRHIRYSVGRIRSVFVPRSGEPNKG